MKKFLTVLLALSVVFTYTVGTAFASTGVNAQANTPATAEQKANLLAAEKQALTQADANFKIAMDEIGDYKDAGSNYVIKAAAWEQVKTEIWSALEKAIKAKTDAEIENYTAGAATGSALVDEVYVDGGNSMLTVSNIKTFITTDANGFTVKAALKQFDADQAEAIKKLDLVDLEQYSKSTPKTGKTYYEMAKAAVESLKEQVNDETSMDKTTVAKIAEQVNNINFLVNSRIDVLYVGTTSIPSGLYKLNATAYPDIKTITEEGNQEITDSAIAAAVKGEVQKQYAIYLTTVVNADKDLANAYVTVYNYLADQGVIKDTAAVKAVNSVDAKKVQDAVAGIADLNTFAAKYKAEKDAEGNLVRDAKVVDDIVTKATKDVYSRAVIDVVSGTAYTVDDAKKDIIAAVKNTVAADLAFEKEAAKVIMEKARKDALENYYPLEQTKVNTEFDKAIALIEAATTVDAAKAVTAPTLRGILKDTEVDALFTTGTLKAEFDAQKAVLNAYVEYKNAGLTPRSDAWVNADTLAEKMVSFYGEKGARTAAEMKDLVTEAKGLVDALPTVGSTAAAKEALEAAIKALPATITVADKDAVEAAWKLMNDYVEMTDAQNAASTDISNKAALVTKINDLHSVMALDLAKKSATAGKTDKEALKSIQAEIDTFNDSHEKDEIFNGLTKYADTTVAKALTDIRAIELKAVKDAIDAIPLNITAEDKAIVEKARALYDAFVKEYTDYTEPYNAVAKVTNFRELAIAEAAISVLTSEEAIKAVESLKLTASSTAGKGYIKVKWTVKGDASYADGYQVYRSVKRNSGFGTKPYFTTKNKTYKNTKSLKKGTRYYYKVRAYKVVDGKKVYSDWSNKAYRIAK